jgi:hypothetical protein
MRHRWTRNFVLITAALLLAAAVFFAAAQNS